MNAAASSNVSSDAATSPTMILPLKDALLQTELLQSGMPVRIRYLGSNTSVGSSEFHNVNFLPSTLPLRELNIMGLRCDSYVGCDNDLGFCAWFVQKQLQQLLGCFSKTLTCSSVRACVKTSGKEVACLTPNPQVGNEWRVRGCNETFRVRPDNLLPWTPSGATVAAWRHIQALQQQYQAGLQQAGLAPRHTTTTTTSDGFINGSPPLSSSSLLLDNDCIPATIFVTTYSIADVAISYFMWPWRQRSEITEYLQAVSKARSNDHVVDYHGLVCTKKLLGDRRVILAALKYRYKHSADVVIPCSMRWYEDLGSVVPDKMMEDDEVVATAVLKLSAYSNTALQLRRVSPKLQNDCELVSSVVATNGLALEFASAALKQDRSVVLAAVSSNGLALQHASPELQGDLAIVTAAVQQNSDAIGFAAPELRNNRQVMLHAVQRFPRSVLQHASQDLRNDKQLVLAAVVQHGRSIDHASAELRRDKDVALATVAHNRLRALAHVDESLQDNDEVAFAAIIANPQNAWCASQRLRSDPVFMLAAVLQESKGIVQAATPELAAHVKDALKARGVSCVGRAEWFAQYV
jgi:hypothetical protein